MLGFVFLQNCSSSMQKEDGNSYLKGEDESFAQETQNRFLKDFQRPCGLTVL